MRILALRGAALCAAPKQSRWIATARFAHLLINSSFVITSPAPPGVVIQLDGHGAKRLAMTLQEFIACFT